VTSADGQFKARDASSYDSVVDYFERYTEKFTAHLPPHLISMTEIADGETVLDVGTGTGVVALQVARQVGEQGRVVGIDLSEGMLAMARRRAMTAGLESRLEFQTMDAESLDFGSESFDAAVSLYALRHFPNPLRAVQELFRVLKPGGRAAVAVGSGPSLLSWHGVQAAARRIGSAWRKYRGRELSACAFLDSLVEQYAGVGPEQDQTGWGAHDHGYRTPVSQLLRQAGFTKLRSTWHGQYSIIDSAEDFWRLQMTFSSVSRKRIQAADEDAVKKLKQVFMDRCESVLQRRGRLVYQSGAMMVAGTKPERTAP
jgi:SAM-dependent methyltransferase